MIRQSLVILWIAACFLAACGNKQSAPTTAAASDELSPAELGEAIFINRCSQCHRMDADMIGPALQGSLARWDNDTARYKSFIRNSQALIKSGDAYANQVFEKWNRTVMVPNEDLSEAEIAGLVEYMNSGK